MLSLVRTHNFFRVCTVCSQYLGFSLSGVAPLTPHLTMRSGLPSWTQSKTQHLTLRAFPARALLLSWPAGTMESPSPVWARPAYWVRHYHPFSKSGSNLALMVYVTRPVFYVLWEILKLCHGEMYSTDSKTVFCIWLMWWLLYTRPEE